MTKVCPCAIAAGMELGLSNSSFKVVTLSFYTMVKSSVPVFVLLFAFLFRLENPTWRLLLIIALICFGVMLMVIDETKFNAIGYLEVQFAAVFSGLRWSLVQMLLQRESIGMNNPLATTLYLSPIMTVVLVVAFLILEGPLAFASSPFLASAGSIISMSLLILVGGVLSFVVIIVECLLIAVTAQVYLFTIYDNYSIGNISGYILYFRHRKGDYSAYNCRYYIW